MNATDRIDYTRPFTENVQGTLYARFRLDPGGAPMYELDGRVHIYAIDVYLHTPKAAEIGAVDYYLGEVSDQTHLGRSIDRHNDFPLAIESGGDAVLVVQVSFGHPFVVSPVGFGRVYEQRAWLSQMLDNGYGSDPPPEVRSALIRVKVN